MSALGSRSWRGKSLTKEPTRCGYNAGNSGDEQVGTAGKYFTLARDVPSRTMQDRPLFLLYTTKPSVPHSHGRSSGRRARPNCRNQLLSGRKNFQTVFQKNLLITKIIKTKELRKQRKRWNKKVPRANRQG